MHLIFQNLFYMDPVFRKCNFTHAVDMNIAAGSHDLIVNSGVTGKQFIAAGCHVSNQLGRQTLAAVAGIDGIKFIHPGNQAGQTFPEFFYGVIRGDGHSRPGHDQNRCPDQSITGE